MHVHIPFPNFSRRAASARIKIRTRLRMDLYGRPKPRRRARSRKSQLAYLLMCYRVARQQPPAFLRADFARRKGL